MVQAMQAPLQQPSLQVRTSWGTVKASKLTKNSRFQAFSAGMGVAKQCHRNLAIELLNCLPEVLPASLLKLDCARIVQQIIEAAEQHAVQVPDLIAELKALQTNPALKPAMEHMLQTRGLRQQQAATAWPPAIVSGLFTAASCKDVQALIESFLTQVELGIDLAQDSPMRQALGLSSQLKSLYDLGNRIVKNLLQNDKWRAMQLAPETRPLLLQLVTALHPLHKLLVRYCIKPEQVDLPAVEDLPFLEMRDNFSCLHVKLDNQSASINDIQAMVVQLTKQVGTLMKAKASVPNPADVQSEDQCKSLLTAFLEFMGGPNSFLYKCVSLPEAD